jgi:hypothetical protein
MEREFVMSENISRRPRSLSASGGEVSRFPCRRECVRFRIRIRGITGANEAQGEVSSPVVVTVVP